MFKDTRRADKFKNSKKHFKKHIPRSAKDRSEPKIYKNDTSNNISRSMLKNIAKETVQILNNNFYEKDGKTIELENLKSSINLTVEYNQNDLLSEFENENLITTQYEIYKMTTLECCYNLEEKENVAILVFASAKNPGGGFLKGSMAQEESIALSSGLYFCIQNCNMYNINKSDNNKCLYSNNLIWCPDVPVFRDDSLKNEQYELLDNPYNVSMIVCPAVNVKVARKRGVSDETINLTMEERIDMIFSVAKQQQVKTLVLGAWGCGVFGGSFELICSIFYKYLNQKYKGCFEKIIFGLLSSKDIAIAKNYFS